MHKQIDGLMRYPARLSVASAVLALTIHFLAVCLFALSFAAERPEWTGRAIFAFGEDLFAVGVATRAKTLEAGRQAAFENGKQEIRNYLQAGTIDGVVIDTPRTWEERNDDGTFSVYRLLRVPASVLDTIPSKKLNAIPPKTYSTPTTTPLSPSPKSPSPTDTSRGLFARLRECEDLPFSERPDCRFKVHEADRAEIAANTKAAQDARDQEVAQKDPEAYKKMMALRIAAKRVEAEKAETEKACKLLQKGFTRDEVELIVGKSSRVLEEQSSPFEVEYLDGRLSVNFDKKGRLEYWHCSIR